MLTFPFRLWDCLKWTRLWYYVLLSLTQTRTVPSFFSRLFRLRNPDQRNKIEILDLYIYMYILYIGGSCKENLNSCKNWYYRGTQPTLYHQFKQNDLRCRLNTWVSLLKDRCVYFGVPEVTHCIGVRIWHRGPLGSFKNFLNEVPPFTKNAEIS